MSAAGSGGRRRGATAARACSASPAPYSGKTVRIASVCRVVAAERLERRRDVLHDVLDRRAASASARPAGARRPTNHARARQPEDPLRPERPRAQRRPRRSCRSRPRSPTTAPRRRRSPRTSSRMGASISLGHLRRIDRRSTFRENISRLQLHAMHVWLAPDPSGGGGRRSLRHVHLQEGCASVSMQAVSWRRLGRRAFPARHLCPTAPLPRGGTPGAPAIATPTAG